ncbi:hypothetical protein QBC40DRAFT_271614 [Triangularia verruculosa]|uniref:Uncharacterized protein n=1 Tax=Triangularia verruculosa TaxID=2587418 RepID=A0AAN7AXH2_9PEZI|nr:hypothetical protein QBC40DRAFT_271614 [Triangularia verruculosa]
MLRPTFARTALRSTRQFHSTPLRREVIKKDGPAGTTSTLTGSNKSLMLVGAAILGVGGTYAMLMGSPRTIVPDNTSGQPVSGTSPASARANQASGKLQ